MELKNDGKHTGGSKIEVATRTPLSLPTLMIWFLAPAILATLLRFAQIPLQWEVVVLLLSAPMLLFYWSRHILSSRNEGAAAIYAIVALAGLGFIVNFFLFFMGCVALVASSVAP